jgi:hypothetical protein
MIYTKVNSLLSICGGFTRNITMFTIQNLKDYTTTPNLELVLFE